MSEFDMCSTSRPYLEEEVLPFQAKEISINMPVRSIKKYRGRPKKCSLSKKSKGQRLRRLKEKLALRNSDVDMISMPRQKELAAQSASDTKDMKHVLQKINYPLHIFSQDTNTIQEISSPVQASSISTGYQYNSTEKTDISQPVCDSNVTQKANLKAIPMKTNILGRRIVDIDYFFNMLKLVNQHSKSGCSLNDVIITNEKKSGLSTSYCLKCTVCDFENILWSECPTKQNNINTDTIAGMLSTDCNFLIMNKLLFKMGLPSLTPTVFNKERHRISSDEGKEEIKITDPNFLVIQYSNKLGESSKLRPQTAARQATTLPKKSYRKNSKELKKNLVLKHKPVTEQVTVSNSLDKSKNCQQYDFNNLLVEDEFEIQNRSDSRYEDESENISSQILDLRTSKNKDNLGIGQRQVSLNMIRTKNEIHSDIWNGKLTELETNEMEEINVNFNRLLGNNNPSRVMLPQQIKLGKTLQKQENQFASGLCKSEFSNMESTHRNSVIEFHNQSKSELLDHMDWTLESSKYLT